MYSHGTIRSLQDFSQNGSLKRMTRLGGESNDETINRLKKSMYAKDERITQLERTVVELQRYFINAWWWWKSHQGDRNQEKKKQGKTTAITTTSNLKSLEISLLHLSSKHALSMVFLNDMCVCDETGYPAATVQHNFLTRCSRKWIIRTHRGENTGSQRTSSDSDH